MADPPGERSNQASSASLCVLDYVFYAGKGTYFFIDVHLEGLQTSFIHDTVKVTGAWGSSLIACHMFCDIWMQFFCWVLLDPRAVCMTLAVVLS